MLTEAIALGGEDGVAARVTLADPYFDLGDPERAQAQLDELRREQPPSPMPAGRRRVREALGLPADEWDDKKCCGRPGSR